MNLKKFYDKEENIIINNIEYSYDNVKSSINNNTISDDIIKIIFPNFGDYDSNELLRQFKDQVFDYKNVQQMIATMLKTYGIIIDSYFNVFTDVKDSEDTDHYYLEPIANYINGNHQIFESSSSYPERKILGRILLFLNMVELTNYNCQYNINNTDKIYYMIKYLNTKKCIDDKYTDLVIKNAHQYNNLISFVNKIKEPIYDSIDIEEDMYTIDDIDYYNYIAANYNIKTINDIMDKHYVNNEIASIIDSIQNLEPNFYTDLIKKAYESMMNNKCNKTKNLLYQISRMKFSIHNNLQYFNKMDYGIKLFNQIFEISIKNQKTRMIVYLVSLFNSIKNIDGSTKTIYFSKKPEDKDMMSAMLFVLRKKEMIDIDHHEFMLNLNFDKYFAFN